MNIILSRKQIHYLFECITFLNFLMKCFEKPNFFFRKSFWWHELTRRNFPQSAAELLFKLLLELYRRSSTSHVFHFLCAGARKNLDFSSKIFGKIRFSWIFSIFSDFWKNALEQKCCQNSQSIEIRNNFKLYNIL